MRIWRRRNHGGSSSSKIKKIDIGPFLRAMIKRDGKLNLRIPWVVID